MLKLIVSHLIIIVAVIAIALAWPSLVVNFSFDPVVTVLGTVMFAFVFCCAAATITLDALKDARTAAVRAASKPMDLSGRIELGDGC